MKTASIDQLPPIPQRSTAEFTQNKKNAEAPEQGPRKKGTNPAAHSFIVTPGNEIERRWKGDVPTAKTQVSSAPSAHPAARAAAAAYLPHALATASRRHREEFEAAEPAAVEEEEEEEGPESITSSGCSDRRTRESAGAC